MPHPLSPDAQAVLDAVLADPVCAALLERLASPGMGEWWLTGGATFQNVWNAVTGQAPGHGIKDYDVFYFDPDTSWEAEDAVIRRVAELCQGLPASIEVRNQARVHLWYAERFGVPATPFTSARDGVDHFASTTCCVGVTNGPGGFEIYAPYGLTDVLAGHMRPNPLRAPREVYETKVREYRERWPFLAADPWPQATTVQTDRMQAQPFLTFQPSRGQRAGEAMRFYCEVFDDGEILSEQLWGADGPDGAEGTVFTAEFTVAGQRIRCSDSPVGHAWDFTPAISLWVECGSAEEQQRVFDTLSKDGMVIMPLDHYGFGRFGWVGDRFGITWQLALAGE